MARSYLVGLDVAHEVRPQLGHRGRALLPEEFDGSWKYDMASEFHAP